MKNKFDKLSSQNKNLSSLIIFNNLIIQGHIKTKSQVNNYFSKLVEKGDYTRGLRDSILEHSYTLIV